MCAYCQEVDLVAIRQKTGAAIATSAAPMAAALINHMCLRLIGGLLNYVTIALFGTIPTATIGSPSNPTPPLSQHLDTLYNYTCIYMYIILI